MVEKVSDHKTSGLSLLIDQYQSLDKFKAYVGTFLSEIQELEDAIYTLIGKQGLTEIFPGEGVAEGVFLDNIGSLVGQPRNGYSDSDYLIFIQARLIANKSKGEIESIISVIQALTGGFVPFSVIRRGQSEVEIYFYIGLTSFSFGLLSPLILDTASAEERVILRSDYNSPNTFTLSDTYATPGTDASLGVGSEYSGAVGGLLVHTREIS